MTNATTLGTQSPPRAKMTMRVYTVDRVGALQEDRGTVSVPYGVDLPPMMPMNPPCECPQHRAGRQVVR
jgi:hypothetical protein